MSEIGLRTRNLAREATFARQDRELPRWQVHDRTHLQLALEYPTGEDASTCTYVWEAYFFIPQSFRMDGASYGPEHIYQDFVSYVRQSDPATTIEEVVDEALPKLASVLASDATSAAKGIEARRFSCAVRGAAQRAFDDLQRAITPGAEDLVDLVARISPGLHAVVEDRLDGPEPLATAIAWVLEDVSLIAEQFLGRLSMLASEREHPELAERARVAAVEQARSRHAWSRFEPAKSGSLEGRDVERVEFMRHTLKRFTSSVLWLDTEITDPTRWAKQVLFSFAASVAMTFAVAATLWNGDPLGSTQLGLWLTVAVIAYAIKDRIKAALQVEASRLLARYYPDRRWFVRAPDEDKPIGVVDETTRFETFDELPMDVLATRRLTRRHPIEELARPETVLWHRKLVRVAADDSRGLTEVFRLDLSRWLSNTDDPKTRLVLADVEGGQLRRVTAPRVYNIGVVYRVWRHDVAAPPPPWCRERVVVSRKGVRRVEAIC